MKTSYVITQSVSLSLFVHHSRGNCNPSGDDKSPKSEVDSTLAKGGVVGNRLLQSIICCKRVLATFTGTLRPLMLTKSIHLQQQALHSVKLIDPCGGLDVHNYMKSSILSVHAPAKSLTRIRTALAPKDARNYISSGKLLALKKIL
ncbi:Uncharacterized protein Fot_22493 [Forsythia ovata]|uniref:Uncharacterized protein n=1 Tax=Forsythia ovata TaxID=205694 RepID=A0ABD1UXW0_9LAMI